MYALFVQLDSIKKNKQVFCNKRFFILNCKFFRLKEDLQGHALIGDMEDCKASLFNLVLTGTATPYFHNGTLVYDSEGKALVGKHFEISSGANLFSE